MPPRAITRETNLHKSQIFNHERQDAFLERKATKSGTMAANAKNKS